MFRAVADTNIYVSVFAFGGPLSRILELSQGGYFELCISPPILREIERVFARTFLWPEERLAALIDNILQFTHLVDPQERLSVIRQDPADDRILECAVAAGAAFLITGDKHLRSLKGFCGIRIVSPRQFLDLIPARR